MTMKVWPVAEPATPVSLLSLLRGWVQAAAEVRALAEQVRNGSRA